MINPGCIFSQMILSTDTRVMWKIESYLLKWVVWQDPLCFVGKWWSVARSFFIKSLYQRTMMIWTGMYYVRWTKHGISTETGLHSYTLLWPSCCLKVPCAWVGNFHVVSDLQKVGLKEIPPPTYFNLLLLLLLLLLLSYALESVNEQRIKILQFHRAYFILI